MNVRQQRGMTVARRLMSISRICLIANGILVFVIVFVEPILYLSERFLPYEYYLQHYVILKWILQICFVGLVSVLAISFCDSIARKSWGAHKHDVALGIVGLAGLLVWSVPCKLVRPL